jgi:NADPH:quinone reductase-like Zn-dependent oxidoreductase
VNFADTLARVGLYADAPKPPMVVGYEVAGTIIDIGDGVDPLRHGERVHGGHPVRRATPRASRSGSGLPIRSRSGSRSSRARDPVQLRDRLGGLIGYGSLQRGRRSDPGRRRRRRDLRDQIAKRFGAEVWGTASPGKHDAIARTGGPRVDYRQDDGGRACRRST